MKELIKILRSELVSNIEAGCRMEADTDKMFFAGVVDGLNTAIKEMERRLNDATK